MKKILLVLNLILIGLVSQAQAPMRLDQIHGRVLAGSFLATQAEIARQSQTVSYQLFQSSLRPSLSLLVDVPN